MSVSNFMHVTLQSRNPFKKIIQSKRRLYHEPVINLTDLWHFTYIILLEFRGRNKYVKEHNKSQNVSSVIRENSGCPQKTLPNPARHPARHEVGHRSGQMTHPVPDTPRRMATVHVEDVHEAVSTLAANRIVIRKKTVQSKVTPLIKQYSGNIAGEYV